ncbi:RDD family protein [Nonomuraea pusilla]|uniref:RDD family protein n=1 Tax=Nonomuraea pusilla TaxID=46177 RepID=A0A1H7MVF9_9ACTN|nr:RDD family protein [Nonomuraea pusilla]SEL14587.1 RDD family protein [Nonomuraea pusilla]
MIDKLRSASEARRAFSSAVDGLVSLACGLAVAVWPVGARTDGDLHWGEPRLWLTLLGVTVAVSFLNHVVLTLVGSASIGKLLGGIRIVREADAARPGFAQMTRRWLWGFYWMIVIVPISIASQSDVNQEDMSGLKVVRA